MKYLIWVHKQSGRTVYVQHKWSGWTIYDNKNGPTQTKLVRVINVNATSLVVISYYSKEYTENSNESIQPPWVNLNYETFG